MKNYFSVNVNAKDFFKTYILFYLLALAVGVSGSIIPQFFLPFLEGTFSFFSSYISLLFGFAMYKHFVSRAMYRGSPFSCIGKLPNFAAKLLLWIFLTVITLGIYTPWLIRNIIQYYLENTRYKEKNGEFSSSASTLLKYGFLIFIGIAVVLLIGVLIVFANRGEIDISREVFNLQHSINDTARIITIPFGIIIFLLLVSLFYFFMFWLINFRFAGYSVKFTRTWAKSFSSILVEFILSAITLGIYAPAAYININRFFLSGSKIMNPEGQKIGTLGFDEKITAEGFRLFWGQALLTFITFGMYGAWALCKLETWLVSHTYIEGDVLVDNAHSAKMIDSISSVNGVE